MTDIPLYLGKRRNILVISGGGIKGFCALGAITKLNELEIVVNPDIYCGTSAGAAICFLLNIGYSSQCIFTLLSELDMSTVVKSNIDNIFDDVHLGLNLCDPIVYVLGTLMIKKGYKLKTTFEDLYKQTNSKLIVTGVCVNDESLHYFSCDTTPKMEVLKAVTISISIPIIFKPCEYDGKIWIDGGVMNNYPIELFNDRLNDVIGIYLDDEHEKYDNFEDVQSYIYKVVKCILRGMNHSKVSIFKSNTIHIKTKSPTFGFEYSKDDLTNFYLIGYNTVKEQYSN
jgi:NTE family protein